MDTVLRLLEVALGYPDDPSQDVIDILTSCINTAKEEILLQGADLDTTKESDINFLFNYALGLYNRMHSEEAMGKGMQKRLNMRIFKKVTETNE